MFLPSNKLFLLLVLLSPVAAWAQPVERSVPLQSKITGVQPMTGIVLWTTNEFKEKYADIFSLEFRYCGYNEVVDAEGRYDFSKIDEILDDVASRNHQAIIRFYFCYVGKETTVPDFIRNRPDYDETIGKSEGKKTHFCDWSNSALQEFTISFYSKIAAKYDNDPRLAFLQTGFGLWAEYHIYDGPREIGKTFPSKEFQASFLKHMDATFQNLPWSVSIDSSDSNYAPVEDNEELLALGFGVFDDSFLCKQHARENAIDWKILGLDRWKQHPGGGEFSYYNARDQKNALAVSGPNGVSFEESAKKFHITYMIGNDQTRYQKKERIRQASMFAGYRFRVTKAVQIGGTLRLTVTNEGIAPIYRDAYFAAGKKRSTTSLKGLLPGENLVCEITSIGKEDLSQITIQCDAILPSQKIEFAADLK